MSALLITGLKVHLELVLTPQAQDINLVLGPVIARSPKSFYQITSSIKSKILCFLIISLSTKAVWPLGIFVPPLTRVKRFTYDELIQCDNVRLDIFWLRDERLEDSENLPAPDVLAQEIVENLGVALEQFESIVEELENPSNPK